MIPQINYYTVICRGSIAPELINSGEISFKSDIYGLGVIITKLLTRDNNYDFENVKSAYLTIFSEVVKLWQIILTWKLRYVSFIFKQISQIMI